MVTQFVVFIDCFFFYMSFIMKHIHTHEIYISMLFQMISGELVDYESLKNK